MRLREVLVLAGHDAHSVEEVLAAVLVMLDEPLPDVIGFADVDERLE